MLLLTSPSLNYYSSLRARFKLSNRRETQTNMPEPKETISERRYNRLVKPARL